MGLPGSEDSLTIGWAVSTQYQRVTDRRTDVQPIAITCAVWLTHVKNLYHSADHDVARPSQDVVSRDWKFFKLAGEALTAAKLFYPYFIACVHPTQSSNSIFAGTGENCLVLVKRNKHTSRHDDGHQCRLACRSL